jgi:hypothetical protein
MLLTQKFHSLREIDVEFIPAIEALMSQHWVDFSAWKEAEAKSPADETFCYWLFFGPTQNSPVGIAQVSFKKIDTEACLPWWKKITGFFDKSLSHWKLARWQLATGTEGPAVFDPRFARSGREKLHDLIKEIEQREDIMAMTVLSIEGTPVHKPQWQEIHHQAQTQWSVLRPWVREHRAYQDYLSALPIDEAKKIQQSWKQLHRESGVTLGDFPTLESRRELMEQCPALDEGLIAGFAGGLLTFQKDGKLLGFVHYRPGHKDALFVEPMPLEPQGHELVSDHLYVQYALLKSHESEVKNVIVVRQGSLFRLQDDTEAQFFRAQGFTIGLISEHDWSRSPFIQ